MKYILNINIKYPKESKYNSNFVYSIIKLYQKYFYYFLNIDFYYRDIVNSYDEIKFISNDILIEDLNNINNIEDEKELKYYIKSNLSYNETKNLIFKILKKTEYHIKNVNPEYSNYWYVEINLYRTFITNLCIIS